MFGSGGVEGRKGGVEGVWGRLCRAGDREERCLGGADLKHVGELVVS